MTYIENIFICLAIPLILSLFFTKGRARSFTLFLTVGMGVCLLGAYVSSFFMGYYGVDTTVAAIEITPVCEEVMKLLPLLFYFLIFEPEPKELPSAAIAIAVGFATFENVCYLTENGAENTAGILGACTGFHAIYNLLITADSPWNMTGYLFPSLLIACLFAVKRSLPNLNIPLK